MDFKTFAYNSVTRNFKAYLGYFLSSTFAIMIFFSFASCLFNPMIINSKISTGYATHIALTITTVMIAIFSLLFIIYSLGTFMKSRFKEFGTLMIIGISDNQFKKLILLEGLIVGSISIVLGIIVGIILLKPFLLIVGNAFNIRNLRIYISIKAIVLTIILFIILFSVATPFSMYSIKNKNIIELLNGSKKPKDEPKPSIILSVLSMVMLITGYSIPLMDSDKSYLMVICIVGGTFLFFSQGLIFVLKKLKKNKKFYMNKTNVLWISNLVYKVRDNSRLLFIMTILLSVTLVSISTMSTLVANQLEDTKSKYPFIIQYLTREYNKDKDTQVNIIEESLKDNGYNYDKTVFNFISIGDTNKFVISQSEFNKIALKLNLDKVNLNENETIIVPRYTDSKYIKTLEELKEFEVGNNKLKVKGIASGKIFPMGYGESTVVVNDNLYNKLEKDSSNQHVISYGYDYKDWEKSADMDKILGAKIKSYGNKEELGHLYTYFALPDTYRVELGQNQILLFIGSFIGAVFFVGSCSFLYFRFYTDLIIDKEKYKNLSKIGLSHNEMKKVLNIEIGFMFFAPYVMAFLNAIFSVIVVSTVRGRALDMKGIIISFVILAIYLLYFILLRNTYIKSISKDIPGYLN